MKPNFFLIGASKCGTTALAQHLAKHPEIFMCEPKEPCFFMYAKGNPYGWPRDGHPKSKEEYLSLFRDSDAKVRGEASTCYIYGEHCAAALQEFAPAAKIIAILRNPLERAYSMYLFWNQFNPHKDKTNLNDFRQAFFADAYVTAKAGDLDSQKRDTKWLKDMGYYGRQLRPFYAAFSREQIHILRYEDLLKRPAVSVSNIYRFLGVQQIRATQITRVNETLNPKWRKLYNWLNLDQDSSFRGVCKRVGNLSPLNLHGLRKRLNRLNTASQSLKKIISPGLRAELMSCYKEDVHLLSTLTKIDFTDWLEQK